MSEQNEVIAGELTEEEQTKLANYQRRANQLLFELGELKVRKFRHIQEASNVEHEAGDYLRQIGARLGLEENQLFRVVDGKVVLVGPQKPRIVKG